MKIAVGMSGGVDSTVATWLLQQQGHEIVGITMQIWDGSIDLPDEGLSGCYGPGEARDLETVRAVAERLGIKHVTVPLAEAYNRCVLDPFRAVYRDGRTPNPCVTCNQKLKFGLLIEEARNMGVEFNAFATGHYVRVMHDAAMLRYRLLKGVDRTKDQSYFLARLTQEQLKPLIFPLGGYHKAEVVKMAHEAGFGDIAERGESQNFIESESYAPLFDAGDSRPGPLIDDTGRMLGEHRGIIHYTVGQRQGLGIATGERLYVKELRPETNTVVVASRDKLFRDNCRVDQVSWIAGVPPPDGFKCEVKLRYHHAGVRATLHDEGNDTWSASFETPQFASAPGQAAVFYDGDEVLGGGWIARYGQAD